MNEVAIVLPTTDADDFAVPVTLGGVRIRLRFRWWPRLQGWYLTATTEAGTPVSDERRLCPSSTATADPTAPGHPPGVLTVVGVGDLSARADLWSAVALVFVPSATS